MKTTAADIASHRRTATEAIGFPPSTRPIRPKPVTPAPTAATPRQPDPTDDDASRYGMRHLEARMEARAELNR